MKNEIADLILLSPSKEMMESDEHKTTQGKQLLDETKKIQRALLQFTQEELSELYGISLKKSQFVKQNIESLGQFNQLPAYQLYDGIAFRELRKIPFDAKEKQFLKHHLVVLSAFYGPLYADEKIWPYRLDFMVKLKLDKTSIKTLWKKKVEDFFSGQTVLNLASKEFSSLINRKKTRVIDVEFVDEKKNISTYEKKKLRGSLAGHLVRAKEINIDSLRSFQEGFELIHEKDQFIYKRIT